MGEGYSGQASVGKGASDFAFGRGGAATFDRVSLVYQPMILSRIWESHRRLETEFLGGCHTSVVSDISDAVGRLYTMDNRIRPLYEAMRRVVGVALTVKLPPGDNRATHRMLSMVQQSGVVLGTV